MFALVRAFYPPGFVPPPQFGGFGRRGFDFIQLIPWCVLMARRGGQVCSPALSVGATCGSAVVFCIVCVFCTFCFFYLAQEIGVLSVRVLSVCTGMVVYA